MCLRKATEQQVLFPTKSTPWPANPNPLVLYSDDLEVFTAQKSSCIDSYTVTLQGLPLTS